MAENWYKRCRRRTLADMHIESWNPVFLSEFDSRVYFQLLKKAHVQGVMIYTNSHVGYCNWPSKSGQVHPAFEKHDKIGEVIDLCHAEGIHIIAYYSLIFNNWAYDTHPEWRMRHANGEGSRMHSRYGLCCPNQPGYRAFVEEQIRELCAHYPFEGVFFDMAFWPIVCHCDACRERLMAETEKEIPPKPDWTNPEWLAFQAKREEWIGEFARFTTDLIKSLRPQASVEHQCSSMAEGWKRGVTDNLALASDYVGGDLYGGFGHQSFVCKLYYGVTQNQPFEYMTSRCKPNLADHTTVKTREEIALHHYLTLAHHGAFLFIDAVDPCGSLDPSVYETVGEVFREAEKFEPYLFGDMISDAGIYFSLTAKITDSDSSRILGNEPAYSLIGHLAASLGAAQILREEHIPFEVVSRGKIAQFPRGKALIVAGAERLTREEEDLLEAFVREGGRLYLSGSGTLGLAGRLFGIERIGDTKETVTYIAPQDGFEEWMPGISRGYPLTMMEPQIRVHTKGQAQVLASTVVPYTDPADPSVFASIHSNPPGIHTGEPAVLHARCGQGEVVWAAAPLEKYRSERHRGVFGAFIKCLMGHPRALTAEAPPNTEFILFDDAQSGRFLIHAVNLREDSPVIPTHDLTVRVRVNGKTPLKLTRIGDGSETAFKTEDGYAVFRIDTLNLYDLFVLDYGI